VYDKSVWQQKGRYAQGPAHGGAPVARAWRRACRRDSHSMSFNAKPNAEAKLQSD